MPCPLRIRSSGSHLSLHGFEMLMPSSQFRAYTDPNNAEGSMAPPSIPPPPPPPPPLNIPPSRARRQLAARLALHQKNNQAAEPSSASLHDTNDNDDESDLKDPFADGEDDLDDDDILHDDGRGSWWRGVVRRKIDAEERGSDDGNDDEEFGDFAMAEDDKDKPEEGSVLLKPLAVNPAKESNRGLSGLWPFGSKGEKDPAAEEEVSGSSSPVDVAAEKASETEAGASSKPTEVKEAKRRTSIEDPDEDEPVKI